MDATDALRTALESAHALLADGDTAEAERRAKAVSALVKAEREVAEFVASRAGSPEEDAEALRDELHRRLDRFARSELADAPPGLLERIAVGRAAE